MDQKMLKDIMFGGSKRTGSNALISPKYVMGGKGVPQKSYLKNTKRDKVNLLFMDSDGDGVVNGLDCYPYDKNRHGFFSDAVEYTKMKLMGKKSTPKYEGRDLERNNAQAEQERLRVERQAELAQRQIEDDANALREAERLNKEIEDREREKEKRAERKRLEDEKLAAVQQKAYDNQFKKEKKVDREAEVEKERKKELYNQSYERSYLGKEAEKVDVRKLEEEERSFEPVQKEIREKAIKPGRELLKAAGKNSNDDREAIKAAGLDTIKEKEYLEKYDKVNEDVSKNLLKQQAAQKYNEKLENIKVGGKRKENLFTNLGMDFSSLKGSIKRKASAAVGYRFENPETREFLKEQDLNRKVARSESAAFLSGGGLDADKQALTASRIKKLKDDLESGNIDKVTYRKSLQDVQRYNFREKDLLDEQKKTAKTQAVAEKTYREFLTRQSKDNKRLLGYSTAAKMAAAKYTASKYGQQPTNNGLNSFLSGKRQSNAKDLMGFNSDFGSNSFLNNEKDGFLHDSSAQMFFDPNKPRFTYHADEGSNTRKTNQMTAGDLTPGTVDNYWKQSKREGKYPKSKPLMGYNRTFMGMGNTTKPGRKRVKRVGLANDMIKSKKPKYSPFYSTYQFKGKTPPKKFSFL